MCKAPKSAYIIFFLPFALHWLPISCWIQCKIALTRFCIVSGLQSELLHLCSLLLSLLSLGCSDLPCPEDGWKNPGGEILPLHWTSGLEFSSFLCHTHSHSQAFFFTRFFPVQKQNKTKTTTNLLCTDLLFLSSVVYQPFTSNACMYL